MAKILKNVVLSPIYLVLIVAAIITYKWWGYDYYSHVIN